jgi:cytochrome c oxidase subunit IV
MSEHDHAHIHIADPKLFIRTFMWLTLLMGATIAAATMVRYGAEPIWSYVANGIALTIAIWKATLVVMNFMGVKFATRLTQVFAILGFIWVTLMGIMVCDYATRHWEPSPGWEQTPASPNTQMTEPRMVNPWAKPGAH